MNNKITTNFLDKFKNTMVMVKLKETNAEHESYMLLIEDYDKNGNILFKRYSEAGEFDWFIPFDSISYLKETKTTRDEYRSRLKSKTVHD